jgi:prepilin-type N-terminal cleavage/methylation domain-containing protein
MKSGRVEKGFTLIELLIVIGIIAILALVIFITLDPAAKFAMARNARRWSDVNAILNGVKQYQVANDGDYPPYFPADMTIIGNGGGGTYDLDKYMVPGYMPDVPFDQKASPAYTCYSIGRLDGFIAVRAECSELGENIELKW